MTRWRTIAIGALVVVLPVGAFIAGQSVSSPAQRIADAAPPEPSVLTAEVVRRPLVETVTLRGEVTDTDVVAIPWPNPPEGFSSFITDTPVDVGGLVEAGSVVVAVSDRPVIVLPGTIPALRDLGPGDTGPDVARLQESLATVGLEPSRSGTFDSQTEDAVIELYRRAGYEPLRGSGGPREGVVVPASEVVFVRTLPARVVGLAGPPGTGPRPDQASLVTLASPDPQVVAFADPATRRRLEVGQEVTLLEEETGATHRATVESVATEAVTGETGSGERFRVVFGLPEDAELSGSPMLATVAVGGTDGAVLAVPVAAVFSKPDGSTFVTKKGTDLVDVAVEVGATVEGMVEIRSSDPDLREGDEVVIGTAGSGMAGP